MKRLLFVIFLNITGFVSASSPMKKAEIHFNKGLKLLNSGKYTEAVDQFSMAIDLNFFNPNYWDRRGTAYFSMKNYYAAISDYTRAISLAPQIGFYYTERSLAYFYLGNINATANDLHIAAYFGEPAACAIIAHHNAKVATESAKYYQRIKNEINHKFRLKLN